MHPAVALGQEQHALVVGQERDAATAADAAAAARLANPRVVVQRVEDGGLAGRGIDRHEPAILVVGGARRRDGQLAVVGDVGIDQRTSRSAFAAPPAGRPRLGSAPPAGGARVAAAGSSTGGAKLPSAHDVLPVFRFRTASRRAILRVADVRAAGNVFGVAGLGDVVRDDRCCARRPARSATSTKTCVSSGDSIRSAARLAILELERRQLVLLAPSRPPSSSRSFCFSTTSISFSSSSRMNCWLSVSRGSGRRGATSVSCVQHRRRRAVERHDEQVAFAHVGDVRVVARPARAGLAAGRPRDPAARAGRRVDDDDVAARRRTGRACAPCPSGRRRPAGSFFVSVVGQLDRRAAVAADDVGRRFVFAGLAPVEVQLLRVGRTSAGRRAGSRRGRARA